MTDTDDWATALEPPPKKPLRRATKIALWLFAALIAWLTLSNASWLAPSPAGKPGHDTANPLAHWERVAQAWQLAA